MSVRIKIKSAAKLLTPQFYLIVREMALLSIQKLLKLLYNVQYFLFLIQLKTRQ